MGAPRPGDDPPPGTTAVVPTTQEGGGSDLDPVSSAVAPLQHDLAIARAFYHQELRLLERTLHTSAAGMTIPHLLEAGDTVGLLDCLQQVREHGRIDFLTLADAQGRSSPSPTPSSIQGVPT